MHRYELSIKGPAGKSSAMILTEGPLTPENTSDFVDKLLTEYISCIEANLKGHDPRGGTKIKIKLRYQ